MSQKTIENPILNSPFKKPKCHFVLNEEKKQYEKIIEERRPSSYFSPVPEPKNKNNAHIHYETNSRLDTEATDFVNQVREKIERWRNLGRPNISPITHNLFEYWTDEHREKKLFFCQIEALETAVYITEAAKRLGDGWIINYLVKINTQFNNGLQRSAFKMATGTGKTVVMAMLIAWQALNKIASPTDSRFSDAFLIVTPGITIRDRLRVLYPNDTQNYYRQMDLLPPEMHERLKQAKIVVTNFHSFILREKIKVSKLTKTILCKEVINGFSETPDQMVNRVLRELRGKKEIVIINDEAHHCYRNKPGETLLKLTSEEKEEASNREVTAKVWFRGVESISNKIGTKAVYDLSATPFFLQGSGYPEGKLFPWVISDFSLMDAIESGLVKIPRLPVDDNSGAGNRPAYLDIWTKISGELPKKSRRVVSISGEPKIPQLLQGALHSLYSDYEKKYQIWKNRDISKFKDLMHPVFIIVCNNTNVSKLLYEYIAGWEKQINEYSEVQAGNLDIFRNDDRKGGWLSIPNTILVDSEQLESGEAMSNDFKKIAAREIEEFKIEYIHRFPGRDPNKLTDEDLLRETLNTVGKFGKLGDNVKCVISVSMLTEGWDANTVTHVLGVRAFSTQLICEQVVGRALRRINYNLNDSGHYDPEYAEIYGVPFTFLHCVGTAPDPIPWTSTIRVRALEERQNCEITFPRLTGYRYLLNDNLLEASFTEESVLTLSPKDVPTLVESSSIFDNSEFHKLKDNLEKYRMNTVAYEITKIVLDNFFRDDDKDDKNERPWLFPSLLEITKRWIKNFVICLDNAFPQLLILNNNIQNAADKIHHGIVRSNKKDNTKDIILPILAPFNSIGTTSYVDFTTKKNVYPTKQNKCHISHVVADTKSWEQQVAQSLEDENLLPFVDRYVKNEHLDFFIPYTFNGFKRSYYPDFIACLDDRHDKNDMLNLIIEVTGQEKEDKTAKTATARNFWIPAVNNHGGFGRWDFIEIRNPWNTISEIIKFLNESHHDKEKE
ncbi:MAG: DEAD/DEAH box helicase family protein [Deltaproteobacteria bacterium]|jgi:type III restriction enzyme|nr:DEAD/DEAH box helicase family protein [Deltaproteobacteria bacterium]